MINTAQLVDRLTQAYPPEAIRAALASTIALKTYRDDPAAFPDKLRFLFRPARYKVAHGGRCSAKSWSFARALLLKGIDKPLRILCAREIQKSIKDSVHQLLCDQTVAMGITSRYPSPGRDEINGLNGTKFIFIGLSEQTVDTIKSYEGIDIVWIEEGQVITERSWKILIPTIRKAGSEIWVSFNPDLESDPTYQRFVVNPALDSIIVQVNWRDNPFFNDVMEAERQDCLRRFPRDYPNVWEGMCRPAVEGAIYFDEVAAMERDGRVCNVPYDPMLKAHVVFDLGFNDEMSVAVVQRHASEVRIIRYIEDTQKTLAHYSAELKELRYNWGKVWLPFSDGFSKDFKTGLGSDQIMTAMGWQVARKEEVANRDVEEGIRQTRLVFPRFYVDKTNCIQLIESWKRYRRHINKQTLTAGAPVHDGYCLGPDSMIRTLHGWKRIADLEGTSPWVWGYSETEHRLVPTKAEKCWKTKTANETVKVSLDHGRSILCTPEHRFMLRTKQWIMAKDLKPGDSLMPLHDQMARSYPQVRLNDGSTALEHLYVYSRLIGYLKDGYVIHHRDEDKTNNNPENLEQITVSEHISLHSSTEDHLAHLRRISNKSGSLKATTSLVAMNKMRSGDNHHTRQLGYWTDDRCRKRSEVSLAFYASTVKHRTCVWCGGTFKGNYRRQYCCDNCKAESFRRRHGRAPSPYRVGEPHTAECQRVAQNHKVMWVEILHEATDVYDITTELHNFVAEGVVVHNSHGADCTRYIAININQMTNDTGRKPMPAVTSYEGYNS